MSLNTEFANVYSVLPSGCGQESSKLLNCRNAFPHGIYIPAPVSSEVFKYSPTVHLYSFNGMYSVLYITPIRNINKLTFHHSKYTRQKLVAHYKLSVSSLY